MCSNREIWEAFEAHVKDEIQKVYLKMDKCDGETFRSYQGEIRALKEMLLLRDRVKSQ